jgi:U3 small nucleolar RNA-associated protein 10
MLRNSDVARFISSLLPDAIKDGHMHRTLVIFHAATLHDYITSSQSLNEGTVAFLLPAILQPLQAQNGKFGSKDSIVSPIVLASPTPF